MLLSNIPITSLSSSKVSSINLLSSWKFNNWSFWIFIDVDWLKFLDFSLCSLISSFTLSISVVIFSSSKYSKVKSIGNP